MSYGLMLWDAAGKVTFDSRNAAGGVCAGAYELAAGASMTVEFPAYPGRSARVLGAFVTRGSDGTYSTPFTSVSYATGYPVVSMSNPPGASPRRLLVMVY